LLRESDKKYVEILRPRYAKKGTGTGAIRAKDYRLRTKARKALQLLTYLAEKLPEDQLEQIFTTKALGGLCGAILRPNDTELKRQVAIADMFIRRASEMSNRPGLTADIGFDEMEHFSKIAWPVLDRAGRVFSVANVFRVKFPKYFESVSTKHHH